MLYYLGFYIELTLISSSGQILKVTEEKHRIVYCGL